MNKPGVIVIEGHVQGLANVRALGEAGIPVWVVDKQNCLAQNSIYCKAFHICPSFEKDEFADFLIDLATKHDLKNWLLLPSNDHAVYTISRNYELLNQHFKLITEKLETLNQIYNKVTLLQLAEKIGVHYPKYETYSSIQDLTETNLNFPVITKGNFGLDFYKKTKTKAIVSKSLTELKTNLEKLNASIPIGETFSQEVLPFDKKNKTISVACFAVNGELKTFWMGKKLREHPLKFGTATLAESTFIEDLVEPSEKLMLALNFTGICEIEFLKDTRDNRFKLIEINARTWLWVGLAKNCGVNFAVLAYQFVNQEEIRFPKSYTKKVVWFNPITNLFFTVKGLLTGQVSLSDIYRNFGKKKVNALFEKGDKKAGWAYFNLLFKIVKTR